MLGKLYETAENRSPDLPVEGDPDPLVALIQAALWIRPQDAGKDAYGAIESRVAELCLTTV